MLNEKLNSSLQNGNKNDEILNSEVSDANLTLNSQEDAYILERNAILLNISSYLLMGFMSFEVRLINIIFPLFPINSLMIFRHLGMYVMAMLFMKKNSIEFPRLGVVLEEKWVAFRCVLVYTGWYGFVIGMDYLRFSTMVCFGSLAPVFVMVFSVWILSEEFRIRYLIGLVICLCGAFMIILNDKGISSSKVDSSSDTLRVMIGVFWGLFHSVCMSLLSVSTKIMVQKGFDNDVQLYYVGCSNFILSVLLVFYFGGVKESLNIGAIIMSFLNGILTYAGIKLLQMSFKNSQIIKLTSIAYIATIQGFFLGAIFLNEKVTLTDIIGSSFVLFYNLYNFYYPIKH